MSGLTNSLNTELLQLSNEARRKHPEIKEAAERSLIILRTLKERPGMDISQELAKNTDFLRPFLLACETKHVKLITTSIGCLHKLISHRAISESSVKTILKILNDVMSQGVVEIQLKILQTVPPLLSNYHTLHGDLLAEALLLCFHLQDSKILVVNNTAAATLRQLVINVFDKVQEEDEINARDGPIKPTSTTVSIHGEGVIALLPCAKDAYCLFQDLCLLTNGENPMYLKLYSLSRTFGLELIESILTNHSKLFKSHPELTYLLRERVCPLIIKNLSDKHDFPQTMRLMRVVYILIRRFNDVLVMECEIFLSLFIKILDPDNPLWQRVISMEIFRGICVDGELLRSIYRNYDKSSHSTNVFHDMINSFGKLAAEKPQTLSTGIHSFIGNLHQGRESIDITGMATAAIGNSVHGEYPSMTVVNSTMKVQCIDQLDKIDPPQIPDTYQHFLALVCLNSIADGLHNFVFTIFSEVLQKQPDKVLLERQLSTSTISGNSTHSQDSSIRTHASQQHATFSATTLKQLESHALYNEVLLVKEIANTAWPGLLATQSFFLTINIDDELFQGVLRAYQNFTIVCGILQLTTPRDAFLTSLCKGAVPPNIISAFLAESKAIHTAGTTTNHDSSFGVTLSDRNLSCLKILLNIAQYLGGVLGDSWYLVLEVLHLADLILFPKHGRSGSRSTRRLGSQNTASSSTTSLANSLTPRSSSSSIHQTTSTAQNIKRNSTVITSSQDASSLSNNHSNQLSAIENDLNILLTQIKKLFDNCRFLEDDALKAFTRSLCKLSFDTIGIPFDGKIFSSISSSSENKTPKSTTLGILKGNRSDERSFAIDKLRSVALLNINRVIVQEPSLIWDLIISHLIIIANYISTPQLIRLQACETLADIVISSMNYAESVQMENDERIQMQLLLAINQLVNNLERNPQTNNKGFYIEVQKMGLETLNKLLQNSGHSFTYGWGMIFDMIKSVCTINLTPLENDEDESCTASLDNITMADNSALGISNVKSSGLIRVAFPCLQLICSDFLSLLSPECLKQCINTLGAFGLQVDDLNISLTAVTLLWNISDFIQTKKSELLKTQEDQDEWELSKNTMNALWMLLLLRLAKICSDVRFEVRNGANQTLFRTIDMNGSLLGTQIWRACIWQVLFPLLNSVKHASEKAVKVMNQQNHDALNDKLSPSQKEFTGFMIHHSRNTADKQWDETKVLVLSGISGIFKNFIHILVNLDDFNQAWSFFLSHLQDSCLHFSHEVAISAIKSLHTMIQFTNDDVHNGELKEIIFPLWQTAWETWERIGLAIITNSNHDSNKKKIETVETSSKVVSSKFDQDTLTAFILTFIDLYNVIRTDFEISKIKRLLEITYGILTYPYSPSYRPDYDYLTPLQEAVLEVINKLDLNESGAPAAVLSSLADYATLAFLGKYKEENGHNKNIKEDIGSFVQTTTVINTNTTSAITNSNTTSFKEGMFSKKSYETITYIVFSKTVMRTIKVLFNKFNNDKGIYSEGVFAKIIWAYGIPMKLKYKCPPSGKNVEDIELWKIATDVFLEIVKTGLVILKIHENEIEKECFVNIWKQLVDVLHDALLTNSKIPDSLKLEQQDIDEAFDMKFLFKLHSEVIIHIGHPYVPQELIQSMVETLKEGSKLYETFIEERQNNIDGELNKNNLLLSSNELFPLTIQNKKLSDKVEGTTARIIPVVREKFAYACLQCLFDLCSEQNEEDEGDIGHRIAQVVAPILLERCASVIRNYTADQPLHGKYPFPSLSSRVQNDEILLILQQLIKLRFRSNVLNFEDGKSTKNISIPIYHITITIHRNTIQYQ
ncbi:10027_t:CDS:10 [Entrophospora sp. SA101]|nr:10027_t:CDS:10 [Entrophospora sp. SA101]